LALATHFQQGTVVSSSKAAFELHLGHSYNLYFVQQLIAKL
jgi:hypothetical protein